METPQNFSGPTEDQQTPEERRDSVREKSTPREGQQCQQRRRTRIQIQRPNGLSQFRQFIYDNNDKTHGIFSDETESAWERRFQGHIWVLRLTLPLQQDRADLGLRFGDGMLLAVAQSLAARRT